MASDIGFQGKSALELAVPRHPDENREAALLADVRPGDWANPQPTGRYALLVVGGGAVGLAAAECAAAAGVRVALATDDVLGLDVLWDAVPRAAILRSASQVCQLRRAAASAWPDARLGRFDFAALRRDIDAAQQESAARIAAQTLAERGIDVYLGPLTFAGPDCLKVAGKPLTFSRALLAPVPRTVVPTIEGLEALRYQTPESLGSLADLPRRWAILGAGAVACELAQAFRRLGSAVDLIAPEPRLFAEHEPVVGDVVQRQFAADGVHLHLGWTCLGAQRTGAVKSLVIERGGQRKKLLADEILVAGERRCDLDWLRLQAANVRAGATGISVDAQCRTSNRRVFAVGSAIADDALQYEAIEAMARLAVGNALDWRQKATSGLSAPRWLRTDPLVCWLGREMAEVADDPAITSTAVPLPPEGPAGIGLGLFAGTASRGAAAPGWLVLRRDRRDHRLVGATIVGSMARELVPQISPLLDRKCSAAELLRGLLPRAFFPGISPSSKGPVWLHRLME